MSTDTLLRIASVLAILALFPAVLHYYAGPGVLLVLLLPLAVLLLLLLDAIRWLVRAIPRWIESRGIERRRRAALAYARARRQA